jgi:hypothetical protein
MTPLPYPIHALTNSASTILNMDDTIFRDENKNADDTDNASFREFIAVGFS